MINEGKFQIGKNGVTEGTINSLNMILKTHNRIRISFLKSSQRNRDSIKEIAEKIIQKVCYDCDYRIIGFTLILKRQSSRQRLFNTSRLN